MSMSSQQLVNMPFDRHIQRPTPGHWIFRSHLNRIGIPVQETLSRKCGEADETAKHVILECPALQSKRSRSLGVLMHTEEGLEQESIVQKISWFCKGLGFDTA
ncbi:hypothetical protein J6590_018125 [Homalodisca vitripennis]|nr:hypothetical protein J6590_018125 [Homalodisca vitripennis]